MDPLIIVGLVLVVLLGLAIRMAGAERRRRRRAYAAYFRDDRRKR